MNASRVVYEGYEGLHLVADVRGARDAWPVLFLHGGGQTRRAWGRCAERLAAEGWRTISIDLRGHGESEWSRDGDYSLTAFGADCTCVVDQLEHPPVVVGASVGGLSAMFAEGTSDREFSSGLVLVDIVPKTNPEGIKRIGDFMKSGLDGFSSLEEVAAAIAAYTPQRARRANVDGLTKVVRERDGRWFWHWDPALVAEDRSGEIAERFADLLELAIGNISVPTLLLRGLLSDVVTPEGVEHLLAQIPKLTLVDVPGAAHMIAGDKNDLFSVAVSTFLNEQIRPKIDRS